MNPNNQVYYSSANDPGRKRRMILVVVFIVLIVGSLAYLIFGDKQKSPEGSTNEQSQTNATYPASSLDDFEFVSPDMKGYIKRSDFTVNVGDYTTPDNSCNLQFGVVPGVELPGFTPEQIAGSHLGATEQAGATGTTPKKGKDLVLKDKNGKAGYAFPTLEYSYMRDSVNYKASYSVVILAENDRAFIRRYCANSDGQVSTKDFDKINAKAKEIKIKLN